MGNLWFSGGSACHEMQNVKPKGRLKRRQRQTFIKADEKSRVKTKLRQMAAPPWAQLEVSFW